MLGDFSSALFDSPSHCRAMSSLRSLVPRAGFTLHSKQLRQRWLRPSIRHASNNPPPKPRVLEKPDKFRPPSHPSRIRSKPRYTGPPLSENERQAQKTRRYPHMMPAEGTFLHWFLSNRAIHVWITLVRRPFSWSLSLRSLTFDVVNTEQFGLWGLVRRFQAQHPLSGPPPS